MSGFRFKAHNAQGKRFRGVIQAASAEEAERSLARQGLIPDLVKAEPLDRSFQLRRSPHPRSMVQFYRQFATLFESGVPLLLSLEILEGLTKDRPLRNAIASVSGGVQRGSTLADAMRQHPRAFSEIAVNVVDAGEEGGALDTTMDRLADYVERDQAVRERVRAAMIYPAFIMLVALGSVATLLTLVVPTFEGMFAASGAALPYPTQILVDTSDFIAANWAFIVAGVLFGVLFLRALYDARPVRYAMHRMVLHVPVVGRLVRKVSIARLSRTMASLLGSGIGVLEAFSAAASTAGNVVIERAIRGARDSVAKGSDISDALTRHSVIPSLVSGMIGVGEQTGKLDRMFEKVADFYERESQTEIEGLLKMLEPALVVLVGITLGGIVAAMYLPIFDAIGAIDPVGV